MNKQPLFTVITPVFNRAAIVTKTFESVANQNFKDFEYILVDDGSTDNSIETIEKAMSDFDNIKLIKLDANQGRCAARNEGLKNASGKWICYLDSDDLYYSNHLEVMFELINNHPEFQAFAVDQHINGVLKKYRRKSLHRDNTILEINDFVEDNPLTANQICHKKDLDLSWSNERISFSEDWLFARSLVMKTSIFKRSIVTNNLIDHDNRSMSHINASKFVYFNLMAANKFIQENNPTDSIKQRILIYTKLLCVNVLLENNLKDEAYKLFKQCLLKSKSYRYKLFYAALYKFLI